MDPRAEVAVDPRTAVAEDPRTEVAVDPRTEVAVEARNYSVWSKMTSLLWVRLPLKVRSSCLKSPGPCYDSVSGQNGEFGESANFFCG